MPSPRFVIEGLICSSKCCPIDDCGSQDICSAAESVFLGDDEGSEGEGWVVVGSMLLSLFECFSGSWANQCELKWDWWAKNSLIFTMLRSLEAP